MQPYIQTTKCESLTALPVELLGLICQWLPIRDIRTLRLLNKKIGSEADCHAFPDIKLYFHHKDFDMIRHLASIPNIAKNVKSLKYITEMMPLTSLSFKAFGREYRQLRQRRVLVVDRSRHNQYGPRVYWATRSQPVDTKELWLQYLRDYSRQLSILIRDLDEELFRDIMPKLTSLRRVALSFLGGLNDYGIWHPKTPFPDIFKSIGDFCQYSADGMHHINALLAPLAEASTVSLSDLQIAELGYPFLLELGDATNFDTMSKACRELKSFLLYLGSALDTRGAS